MKNIIRGMVFAGTILLLNLPAFAASPTTILPASTEGYVTISYDNIGESIQTYIEMGFDLASEEILEEDNLTSYVVEHLKTNTLHAAALKINNSFEAVLMTEMSESEYENNILPELEDSGVLTEIEGIDTYQINNSSITYIDGVLVIAENNEVLEEMISLSTCSTNCEESLSDDNNFEEVMENLPSNSAVTVYIRDLAELLEDDFGDSLESSIVKAMDAQGYAIAQNNNVFTLKSYITYHSNILTELGLNFSNTSKPSLYKLFPKNDPIFFADSTTSGATNSIIKSSEDYDELIDDMESELSLNTDTLLDLLENEIAMLVSESGELIPNLTILADVSGNSSAVQNEIDKVIAKTWNNKLSKKTVMDGRRKTLLEKGTSEVDGGEMTTFKINHTIKQSKNPYAPHLDEDNLEFLITVGITEDDIFLFSTDKNIENTYGEGLGTNAEIKAMVDKSVDNILLIDTNNLEDYIETALTIFDESKVEKTMEGVSKILGPWGKIISYSKSSNTSGESTLEIELDVDKFVKNMEFIMDNGLPSESLNLEQLTSSDTDFNDVEIEDWYGDDVYYLSTKGIVNGYHDGDFRPENTINRAEFIAMIIRTLKEEELLSDYDYSMATMDYDQPFNDTPMYEWYTNDIKAATYKQLINGYNDKTFRPNNTINRGEVAQIMANVLKVYNYSNNDGNTQISFGDVASNAWYRDAVKTVFKHGIMKGKTDKKFDPASPLNRAEAAKLIRNLIKLIEQ